MTITIEQLNEQQRYVLKQAMSGFDRLYDPAMQLIGSGSNRETDEEVHSTRGSAHYALGLLLRDEPGDLERACQLIDAVLELQFVDPEEIYYGTFRTSPQAALPPSGNYPWKKFGSGVTYFLNDTFDKFTRAWLKQDEYAAASDQERRAIRAKLTKVFDQVIPPVWKSYDPNWREFIASTFAVVLELFEAKLPAELVARIDQAMKRTVQGSIDRRLSDAIPMNTNIELMHLFIADYFADRYQHEQWIEHAKREMEAFLQDFRAFGTFAEFNSATYYGVDLSVLGLIRKFSKLQEMKQFGEEVEAQLWRTIAQYYNANMENMAGPFSRAYEMELVEHSSIGVFLYLALGEDYVHLAGENCETSHDTLIALLEVAIPEDVIDSFRSHTENRFVKQQFKELCEWHEPGNTRHLCTASSWIERNMMLGALSGSQNTSGQLHPATIHWQNEHGEKYYLRLLRREPGGHWSTHYRGILYDAVVDKRDMSISVQLSADHNLEVFFQISGPQLEQASYEQGVWNLPGLTLTLDDDGLQARTSFANGQIEHIYSYDYTKGPQTMRFKLSAQLTYE